MNTSTATHFPAQQEGRRIAAVVAEYADASEDIIDHVISDLQRKGVQVAGLRQRIVPGSDIGCGVRLEDIRTGELHRITQDLGHGSVSCNIDTEAVEQLAMQQSGALDKNIDLLIVNRFGKRESEGRGFCCLIERAIELDIPVLTVVRNASVQAWFDYGGDWVMTLPVSECDIRQWCDNV